MTFSDIPHHRLYNQQISHPAFDKPGDEVRWLGAVQSQDYAAAKWALGLRLRNAVDDLVEQAFTDGAILRTHVMRPTWHFVAPEDIRWLLALTAPRVNAASAYQYRKLELDQKLFKRSNAVLAKALRGGNYLTRDELRQKLADAGISTDDLLRSTYIVMRAELDGIICSGPRRGKQFTYALLEERAPQAGDLPRDEALAELAGRFFTSHGPATVHDLAKWSGLTIADATSGLEEVQSRLEHELIDGHTHWFAPSASITRGPSPTAYLLPSYDEYTIGYRNHDAVFNSTQFESLIYNYTIVIDGQVVGTWRRTLKKDAVMIELNFFTPPTKAQKLAVAAAADRYGKFLGLSVVFV
jgi:hypothetical protein